MKMKRLFLFLLTIICYLLLSSSCFGGRSQQKSLPLGCTEKVTDNISYVVTNNSAENRFEVAFIVENSADAWFSISIGSYTQGVSDWSSDDTAEPPVSITDSNGTHIKFGDDGYYRFNKSMTFYISYSNSPEELKEFFSGFSDNEGSQWSFTLDINDLHVVSDNTYDPKSDTRTGD